MFENPEIDLIVIAAVPSERAALAIEAMENGKDVMVDKPGCTTVEQLEAIKECVARTGRIWSVNFSERFQVACVTKAAELIEAGEIGDVIQTVGLGLIVSTAIRVPIGSLIKKNTAVFYVILRLTR